MTAADVRPGTTDPASRLPSQRTVIPRYGMEIGPVTHLAAERERLDALQWQHFDVRRMSATIGAEISGIDLRDDLADEVIAEVRAALVAFKVIGFRNQPLTAGQHVAFAKRFGELEVHPFLPPNAEHPELVRFEKGADTAGYENAWHADVTWRERPSLGAILHAIEVPPSGGDTLFADMTAAYDGLGPEVQARIDGLVAVHDFAMAFGHNMGNDEKAAMRERYPLAHHPVVRTHPESGRRIVFVNRIFTSHIEGMDFDESTVLIDQLSRTAETVEYQCRWTWEPDSVVFWDNRSAQHYASSDYWPARRVMERASIIGDRPV